MSGFFRIPGGANRNRTDLHGFAIRCITSLPLRQVKKDYKQLMIILQVQLALADAQRAFFGIKKYIYLVF